MQKTKEKICVKENCVRSLAKNKGITLVALVITIIVLLILAGVGMSALTGDNGIITKAKNAKIATEIANIKEEIQTHILGKQAENGGNISDNTLEEILLTYGELSKEGEKLTDKILTTTKGNHDIKVSDIFNGTTVNDDPKNPTFTTVANAPDISGFNKTNTYYVAWDLNEGGTEYFPNEINMNEVENQNKTIPNNWYDYTSGINHWANIKTTGGGNDCYWVWIPRYAYKVPTKGGTAEIIDIKFLKNDTNVPIGETEAITNTTPTPGLWVVHPAFTNEGNGGLGNLAGIWVAKFEASSSSVNTINIEKEGTLTGDTNSLNGSGGGNTTDLQVRVKPNVTSWRGITVNNIFTVCGNLTEPDNSLCGANNTKNTNMDSHMMKNTEWGAIAYLSMSVYGKNGEVWNNPYYNNTTNYSPITGLCGNETNGKDNGTTDINKTYKYNENDGGNASTTGNVYGVYDMAGGAWEYVAGIYKGTTSDNLGNNTNRSNLWDSSNSKYVDQYTETTGSQSTYFGNTNKYGDAVYETSSSGDSNTGSWDSSYSIFPDSRDPVFPRGGHAFSGSHAGVFAFYYNTGGAFAGTSFRPVVISSQP